MAVAHPSTRAGSLDELATEINSAHAACESSYADALEHAFRCGELLIQAKAQLPHGGWTSWLAENFAGADRTARAYTQLARTSEEERRTLAGLGVYAALKTLAAPRKAKTGERLRALATGADLAGAMDELVTEEPPPRRASLAKGVGGRTWRNIKAALAEAERAHRAGCYDLELMADVNTPDALAAEDLRLGVDDFREEIGHLQEAIAEALALANFLVGPRR
jgi:hypothetical protein